MKRNWIRWELILFTLVLSLCLVGAALADSVPTNATTLVLDETVTATITANQLTYFKFVPSKTANYAFYSSCNEDTYAYLFTAEEGKLQEIDSNDDGGERNNFQIKRVLTEGTEYYFGVRYLSDSRAGSFPVTIEEFKGLDVKIAGNSSSFSGEIGETVNLAVEATSGKGTVTYQWISVDENNLWTDIEDQTEAAYTATVTAGSNRYICRVTDGITTQNVSFYVTGDDHFTASAVGNTSISVAPNESVTMEVTASSDTNEFTYQWSKNWNDETGMYYSQTLTGAEGAAYTEQNISRNTNYTCEVKSASGSRRVYFYVHVNAPITIETTGETWRTIARGGAAEMTITATSVAEPLQYQWYSYSESSNGYSTKIEGATEATYRAENIQEQTTYYCQVRNAYSSATSTNFEINIEGNFSATTDYSTIDIAPGGSFSTTVRTYDISAEDCSYQWYGPVKNKREPIEAISGETGRTLSLENTSAAGYYLCKVTGSNGIEKNVWVQVRVNSDLSIDSNYETTYAMASDGATISVSATSSAGDVDYQWYEADENRSGFDYAHKIEGATSSSYTIVNPQKSYYYYYCGVSDIYGNFMYATRYVGFNGSISIETIGDSSKTVAPGGTATFTVSATGDGEITYQWRKRTYVNGEWGEYQVIDGATGTTCTVENVQSNTEIICNARSPFGQTNISYYVRIDNQLRVTSVGDSDKYVSPNGTVTLETEVNKVSGDVTYQWYRRISDKYGNSANIKIPGATEATYTTGPITAQEYYYCYVNDSYGNSNNCGYYVYIDNQLKATVYGKTSRDETMRVTPGANASMKVAASATNMEGMTYQWEKMRNGSGWQIISSATGSELTEAVTEYTEYKCTIRDQYNNTATVYFYVGIENNLVVRVAGKTTTEDSFNVAPGAETTMRVSVTANNTEGITYRWYKRDNKTYYWTAVDNATTDSLTQTITEYSAYYCTVTDAYNNNRTVHFYIGIENNLVVIVEGKTGREDHLTATPGESVTMGIFASATNMEGITYTWSKYDRTNSEGYQIVEGATGTKLTDTVDGYTSYQCYVEDIYGNNTSVYFYVEIENNLMATVAGETYNNKTLKVALGGTATMEVTATATNTEGMTYTWRKYKNGQGSQTIAGANGNKLTDTVDGYTQYYCEVRDLYGNNKTVYFYVKIENGLTVQAVGETRFTVKPGQTATLQATATCNDGNMTYRWCRGYSDENNEWQWEEIAGATGTSYTTEPMTYQCTYYFYARDMYGTEEDVSFQIGIDNQFTVTRAGDHNVTVEYGGTAEMTVSASCLDGNINYQWYRHYQTGPNSWSSEAIAGATTETLTVENVTRASEYYCEVSDKYRNRESLYFRVNINNNLRFGSYESNRKVTKGTTATLTVSASCDSGADQLTYQWYEETYNEEGDYYTSRIIQGATEGTFTTEPINAYKRFECRVTDIFGNVAYAYINIGLENHLTATADGDDEFTVSIGESVTMKVTASCDDDSGLGYQWFIREDYEDGWRWRTVNGATSNTFTLNNIQNGNQYYCRVSDGYEDPIDVNFTIRIENGLKVAYSRYTAYVGYDEDVVLEAEAVCLQGDLTYKWYVDGYRDGTTTGPVYTFKNVRGRHYFNCYVTDTYGNEERCHFEVNVENHMEVEIGSIKVNGTTIQDIYNERIVVPNGGTIEITMLGNCDEGDITYSWSGESLSKKGETLTLSNLTKTTWAECLVSDKYNTNWYYYWTFVVDNGFTLTADGATFREVNVDDQVTLKVNATKASGDITYIWYKNGQKMNETGDSITFTADKTARYICRGTDTFGTSLTCEFTVKVGAANVLKLDETVTVSAQNGIEQYFFFTPSESGTYVIQSTGSQDPNVTLYDSNGNYIGNDDESGNRYNFKLAAELTAGVQYRYYVYCSGYNVSFKMKLSKVQESENYVPAGTYVMQVGQTARLPYSRCTVTSSATDVVTVSETTLTANKAGTAKVSINWGGDDTYVITVNVRSGAVMTMPSSMTMIETEAFSNDASVHFVTLGDNTNKVGYFAFADSGLWQIVVPSATTKLSVSAFYGINPTILCLEGSAAEEYAQQNGYRYMYID